jgi:hypothetical protein
MKNVGLRQGKITTLEEFLKLPYIEESPAWEYINFEAIQKPMKGGKHSLLQKRLVAVIDGLGSNYEAFQNLVAINFRVKRSLFNTIFGN